MLRMVAVLLLSAVLAGCLSDAERDEDDVPVEDPRSDLDRAQSSTHSVDESGLRMVEVGHGDVRLVGLDPGTQAILSLEGIELARFEVDANGSLHIGFLEPNTTYALTLDGDDLVFTTNALPWEWSTEADPLIQPGMLTNNCALSVIVRDAAYDLYGVSAGHCADDTDVFTVYRDGGYVTIGNVVFMRLEAYPGIGQHDYAFFAIPREFYPQVNPAIKELGGPTGLGYYTELEKDDRLCFYGQGMRDHGLVGAYRCGEYEGPRSAHPTDAFWIRGFAYGGDSGSPLLNETGAWHGIIVGGLYYDSHVAQPACNMLHQAHLAGLDLQLVTAPLTGAEPGIHPPGTGIAARALHAAAIGAKATCGTWSPWSD